jgi:energy-coupling factor transport system permease protein
VHPLIRLHSLLVFILLMALGGVPSLLLGYGLLLGLYAAAGLTSARGLWRVVRRTRWLLLSILLLYGWWTPGTPLWAEPGALAPSLEGLGQGAVRAGLLVAIVAAVHWVMTITPRPELLAAVVALTAPLRHLGIAHERLAVRILLTLEAVPQVQQVAAATLREPVGRASRLAAMACRARLLYGRILAQAEAVRPVVCEVRTTGPVPRWQWLIPPATAVLLSLGHGLVGLG